MHLHKLIYMLLGVTNTTEVGEIFLFFIIFFVLFACLCVARRQVPLCEKRIFR